MTRCLAIFVLAASLVGCGRAVSDNDQIKAMNLKDGTVKTFSNAGAVPEGWGICSDPDCGEVPPAVPCQNLGEQVCTKNTNCRLRQVECTGSSNRVEPVETPQNADSSDAFLRAPTCAKVCVHKDTLQCDEIDDEKGCGLRSDCEWSQQGCPLYDMAPCVDPDNCGGARPYCPPTCHFKTPQTCEQLDEASCTARDDCAWKIEACPMIGCEDPDDDVCQCKPFCQPEENLCADDAECAAGEYCSFDGCGWKAGNAFAPDVRGTCKLKPDGCPANHAPVCGCDGKTYGNDCVAASKGINVQESGPCDAPVVPPAVCEVGGCNGEICADNVEGIGSPCVELPEHACLKLTRCGSFGSDGGCGWEQNEAYLDCLALAKQ